MIRKAFAFILRHTADHGPQLLVLAFAHAPHLPLRLPGGNLEPHEAPLAGMARDLREETEIETFRLIRKLGVKHYYKHHIDAEVERHDFLLEVPANLGDGFSYTVQGHGTTPAQRITTAGSALVISTRWITNSGGI